MTRFVLAAAAAATLAGCAHSGHTCSSDSRPHDVIAEEAHGAYVDAINSNDTDAIMAVMTDDVVFMAPDTPRMVGKDAVRPWVAGYLEAFTTQWEKTTLEFVVCGEWAFEQYAYAHTDVSRENGDILVGAGKGLIVYHLDDDGVWRVARDAWNDDPALVGD